MDESSARHAIRLARAAGVELWFEGRRLRFRAPPDALSTSLRTQLREHRDEILSMLRSEAGEEIRMLPVAENQRGLWFLWRLNPESAAYNVVLSLRIDGALVSEALEEALQVLVDRHDVLRTTYIDRGGVPFRAVRGHQSLPLEREERGGRTEADVHSAVREAAAMPFDLERGPIVRAKLFEVESHSWILLLAAHHIAIDGTSVAVLFDELMDVYAALQDGSGIPPRSDAATYEEFVQWQTDMLKSNKEMLDYWASVLTPPPPKLDLPRDQGRPSLGDRRDWDVRHTISVSATERLRSYARANGVTDFVVLLSAWYTFLRRISGQTDITVGTPMAGRPSRRFARAVGDFMNIIPLRMRSLTDISFNELVSAVRLVVLDGLARHEVPLPTMIEHRAHLGVMSDGLPFNAQFAVQEYARGSRLELFQFGDEGDGVRLGDLTLRHHSLDQVESQFELSLDIFPGQSVLRCQWRFDGSCFHRDTIERWTRTFETLLDAALQDPGQSIDCLPVLAKSDETQLECWNATAQAYPSASTITALIAAQAARTPEAVAVRAVDGAYTYTELLERARAITQALSARGVARGDRVGVQLPRGRDLVPALLGVLGSGASYVPLDPLYPAERRAYMLADAGAVVLLSSAAAATELTWTGPVLDPALVDPARVDASGGGASNGVVWPRDTADGLAYVIYTSGSTGQPKGVSVSHRAVVNFLTAMAREPGLTASDILLAVTTVTFDIAGLELFLPLTVGARVVLATEAEVADGRALAARLVSEAVTVMQATPATWKLLLATGWAGKADLRVLCGGEALPEALAEALLTRVGALWNLYGPTETTIWSTCERVTDARPILIGRPIANTTCYVLDAAGQRTPIGVPGELWIGGAGVADGYFGREALTAERFQDSPFRADERIYRTGDLVRLRADGRLQHLGRLDHQVKLRGFRIELGEIEAALRAQIGVEDAVVVADADRLLAYVVGAGEPLDPEAIRRALSTTLPGYMVPARIIGLAALPLTANGKVDRRALPAPDNLHVTRSRTAPVTETERVLALLWSQTLSVNPPSLEDSFFEYGGHSFLAVQLLARIREAFSVELPILVIFESDTLGALAKEVDKAVMRAQRETSVTGTASEVETFTF